MRAVLSLAILASILPAQSLEDQLAGIAKELQPALVDCRRDIHMHPELSNQEVRTGKLIADKLKLLGLEDIRQNVAGNGVTAVLRGGKPGPVVAWRADMDALPIDESNFNVPYKSTVKGVKHACGHDAHVAIGLGIAEAFSKVRQQLPGTIKFVFQPAEEGGLKDTEWGAKLMIREGALENPKPSAIFAFHVAPNIRTGQIAYTENAASSSSTTIGITFTGKRAHGAYPYQGIDAVAVASQCVSALQSIHSRRIAAQDPSVFSLGTIEGGDRRNVIAESVQLTGTLRTFSDAITDKYEAMIRQTLNGCTTAMGATYSLQFTRGYAPMNNNPQLIRAATPTLERILGKQNLIPLPAAMFAEDFSYFQRIIPGVMFNLGIQNSAKGITAGLHTAEMDLDEDALSIGVHAGSAILLNYLQGTAQ